VACLQDLFIFLLRRMSTYVHKLVESGSSVKSFDDYHDFSLFGLYATLTNVNFDDARFHELIVECSKRINQLKKLTKEKGIKVEFELEGEFDFKESTNWTSLAEAHVKSTIVGIEQRIKVGGEDAVSLQELIQYGLKGLSAYTKEAKDTGNEVNEEVVRYLHKAMAFLSDSKDSKAKFKDEENLVFNLYN
jgi:hydroxylamine reductase